MQRLDTTRRNHGRAPVSPTSSAPANRQRRRKASCATSSASTSPFNMRRAMASTAGRCRSTSRRKAAASPRPARLSSKPSVTVGSSARPAAGLAEVPPCSPHVAGTVPPRASHCCARSAQDTPAAHHRRQIVLGDLTVLVDVAHREAIPRRLLELLARDAAVVIQIEPLHHAADFARDLRLDSGFDLARFQHAVGVKVELLEATHQVVLTFAAVPALAAMVAMRAMHGVTVVMPVPPAAATTAVLVIVIGALTSGRLAILQPKLFLGDLTVAVPIEP